MSEFRFRTLKESVSGMITRADALKEYFIIRCHFEKNVSIKVDPIDYSFVDFSLAEIIDVLSDVSDFLKEKVTLLDKMDSVKKG